MNPYRIVLADDHTVIRQGLKLLIEETPELEVSEEASDGFELLEILKNLSPDMVILDISMPNMRGIEATSEIRKLYPDIKILLLTMHKNIDYLHHAFKAGAHGYLLKEDSDIELLSAIETIKNGGTYITDRLSHEMKENISKIKYGSKKNSSELLTLREREILKLIVEGKTNKEIADLLFISNRTVEGHRGKMMKKLNFKKSTDLMKYAVNKGFQ